MGSPIPEDRADLRAALSGIRDRWMADFVTVLVGLAVETHPVEIRAALAKVFDLSAVEETARRMMLVIAEANRAAQEARDLIASVRLDLDALESRIDALQYEVEEATREV